MTQTKDSPAPIAVTDRDVAAHIVPTEFVVTTSKVLTPLTETPSYAPEENAAVQHIDTTESEPTVSVEQDIKFLLDAMQKILGRLEALEDLNLEERLARYNRAAPHKI